MPDLLFRAILKLTFVDFFGRIKFQDEIEKRGFNNFNWKYDENKRVTATIIPSFVLRIISIFFYKWNDL